jgi:hypothetical protein
MATPPLVVLLAVGIALAVLLSGGGSKAKACGGRNGASPSPSGHCRQRGASEVAAAGGSQRGVSGARGVENAAGGNGVAQGVGHRQPVRTTVPPGPSQTLPPSAGTTPEPVPLAAAGSVSLPAGSISNGALASGHTETGEWATESVLGVEIEPTLTVATISFAAPLRHPLNQEHVVFVKESEVKKAGTARKAAIRAACGDGGTVDAPTAMPGYLCVYARLEDFRDRTRSGGIPTHIVNGKEVPFVDAHFLTILRGLTKEPGGDKTGARVAFAVPDVRTAKEEAVGAYPHLIARGTWAVTAP